MVRLVVSVIAVVLLLAAGPAFAHGPSAIEASYDLDTHILRILALHSVRNADEHYVNKIKVELNGKKIVEQRFQSQTDREHQETLFMIRDAEVGDEVEITATCNISGKKVVSIRVRAPEPVEEGS